MYSKLKTRAYFIPSLWLLTVCSGAQFASGQTIQEPNKSVPSMPTGISGSITGQLSVVTDDVLKSWVPEIVRTLRILSTVGTPWDSPFSVKDPLTDKLYIQQHPKQAELLIRHLLSIHTERGNAISETFNPHWYSAGQVSEWFSKGKIQESKAKENLEKRAALLAQAETEARKEVNAQAEAILLATERLHPEILRTNDKWSILRNLLQNDSIYMRPEIADRIRIMESKVAAHERNRNEEFAAFVADLGQRAKLGKTFSFPKGDLIQVTPEGVRTLDNSPWPTHRDAESALKARYELIKKAAPNGRWQIEMIRDALQAHSVIEKGQPFSSEATTRIGEITQKELPLLMLATAMQEIAHVFADGRVVSDPKEALKLEDSVKRFSEENQRQKDYANVLRYFDALLRHPVASNNPAVEVRIAKHIAEGTAISQVPPYQQLKARMTSYWTKLNRIFFGMIIVGVPAFFISFIYDLIQDPIARHGFPRFGIIPFLLMVVGVWGFIFADGRRTPLKAAVERIDTVLKKYFPSQS